MTDMPLETAVMRLERAIARLERAAATPPAPSPALAELEERHRRLRARVGETIGRLDALIAPQTVPKVDPAGGVA